MLPTTPRLLLPTLLAAAVLPLAAPALAQAATPPAPREPHPPRVAHRPATVAVVPTAASAGLRGDVLLAATGSV